MNVHHIPRLSLLLAAFFALHTAHAQPPGPAAAPNQAQLAFTLPLERSVYFIGESIPLALNVPGARLELVDAKGAVVAAPKTSTVAVWRIETGTLAPGEYLLRANGVDGSKITLVDTHRPSPGAVFDEWLPSVPWQQAQDKSKVAAWNERIDQLFRESQLDAFVLPGQDDARHYGELDQYARYRTMLWTNLYTRPISFVPARVYDVELEGMTQRMAHAAAMNARYPNFGGIAYHWDPTGIDRSMLLIYWGWNEYEKPLRAYNKRSLDAVYDDFRKRTGLEPVLTGEFLQYALAIGQPQWASAFDLPTAVWMREISKKTPPLSPEKLAMLEKRVDAWSRYLMGIVGETNAYHQKWMKRIAPTMTNTSSHDNEYSPKDGSWPPGAYEPLDFRWIEAWSDQVGGPDYVYQWLFHAAIADVGSRAGQPVWVGSVLGWAHHQADYPGRFSRTVAQNLAYNGRGIGLAVEGFTNITGGMYEGTNWWNMKGTAGEEDYRLGREWIRRFAPLQEQCAPVASVGVLLSESQYGRQWTHLVFDKPQFNAFITLARLGYTPRFVTENEILKSGLKGYSALVVVNQSVPLPSVVLEKLKTFGAGGGKVYLSENSTASIPGSLKLNVAEPDKRAGRPHNWSAPNILGKPSAVAQNERFDELAPAFRTALGDSLRTPLLPEGDEASRISTFALSGGTDATYVVATNDSFVRSPSTWEQRETTLRPNAAKAGAALYDLSEEKYLGTLAPVKAGFKDRTARLYALLARPVVKLDVRATQKITAAQSVVFSVAFVDASNKPLQAAIPFHVKWISPDGASVQEFYRSTSQSGTFNMEIPTALNTAPGGWSLEIRSLLDGKVVTLPVEIRAGNPKTSPLSPVDASVITRGDFPTLWKNAPSIVAPIFDGPNKAQRLAAAQAAREALAAQGVKIEIIENPVTCTYTLGYDPKPEELAENARVDKGEAFGKIKRATINGNDWFATSSGWVYPAPILLLDAVGVKDDPMAEVLDERGMLWPKTTTTFPGAGHATVQIVKSAFKLGMDAVVIQASDDTGLLAGAKGLSNLPADWISGGIETARTQLTKGLSIGSTPEEATTLAGKDKVKLTDTGAQSAISPQPLLLKFTASSPPLPGETKPWQLTPPSANEIPALLEIPKAGVPYMLEGQKWIRADTPGGDWPSDLRFSEATLLKLKIPQAGKYRFDLNGLFRFSDRKPATQSTWEEIIDLYMNTVRPTREPMCFEVTLDGKPLDTLKELKTSQQEVVIRFGTAATGAGSNKATEEAGTQISGVLDLPAGEHDLLFIHKNIVDGIWKSVEVMAAN